jgi:hypothetical protein
MKVTSWESKLARVPSNAPVHAPQAAKPVLVKALLVPRSVAVAAAISHACSQSGADQTGPSVVAKDLSELFVVDKRTAFTKFAELIFAQSGGFSRPSSASADT